MLWSTYEKRGFLRSVRKQAAAANLPLEDALLALLEGRYTSVSQGRVLISMSNEAGSSGWIAPSKKSQSDVLALVSELMDLRDQVEANLGDTFNEEQLFQGMLAHPRLIAIKGYTSNFMYMAK